MPFKEEALYNRYFCQFPFKTAPRTQSQWNTHILWKRVFQIGHSLTSVKTRCVLCSVFSALNECIHVCIWRRKLQSHRSFKVPEAWIALITRNIIYYIKPCSADFEWLDIVSQHMIHENTKRIKTSNKRTKWKIERIWIVTIIIMDKVRVTIVTLVTSN